MKKLIAFLFVISLIIFWNSISKSIKETLAPTEINTVKKKLVHQIKNTSNEDLDIEETKNQKDSENVSVNFLKDIKKLDKAQQSLQKLPQYAGKKIMVYSKIHFYSNGRIILMLQHPINSKNVDEYEYRNGVWSSPHPVFLSDYYKTYYNDNIFLLDEIKFTDVAKLVAAYEKKAKEIESAEPLTHVYILTWGNNKLRWYPTGVMGTRESLPIHFKNS
ncbi:hypothetical protein [Flavobacterium sp.]|uniref:hypothetical protein n=1 Tax=Flavobacterium sp. TaxID=239 RepID=UPI0031D97937